MESVVSCYRICKACVIVLLFWRINRTLQRDRRVNILTVVTQSKKKTKKKKITTDIFSSLGILFFPFATIWSSVQTHHVFFLSTHTNTHISHMNTHRLQWCYTCWRFIILDVDGCVSSSNSYATWTCARFLAFLLPLLLSLSSSSSSDELSSDVSPSSPPSWKQQDNICFWHHLSCVGRYCSEQITQLQKGLSHTLPHTSAYIHTP